VHQRLVPGFVLDARLDGDARIVTFANGTVARELLVDCDEARRRLVYAVISERLKQHSASVQVLADGDTRARLIWTVDLLPHEMLPLVPKTKFSGLEIMKMTTSSYLKIWSHFLPMKSFTLARRLLLSLSGGHRTPLTAGQEGW